METAPRAVREAAVWLSLCQQPGVGGGGRTRCGGGGTHRERGPPDRRQHRTSSPAPSLHAAGDITAPIPATSKEWPGTTRDISHGCEGRLATKPAHKGAETPIPCQPADFAAAPPGVIPCLDPAELLGCLPRARGNLGLRSSATPLPPNTRLQPETAPLASGITTMAPVTRTPIIPAPSASRPPRRSQEPHQDPEIPGSKCPISTHIHARLSLQPPGFSMPDLTLGVLLPSAPHAPSCL